MRVMTHQNARLFAPRFRLRFGDLAIALMGLVIAAPVLSVIWMAFNPTENIWPHLMQTVLPRYLRVTILMMLGVGLMTAIMGAGTAWAVTVWRFPGRSWLEKALFFPMAIPAYIGAYALVNVMDYAGPVQTALRQVMGWTSVQDYWFPEFRSVWGAILVLSAALYPYVYLLARAAFREQSGSMHEVARALGCKPFALFWRVGLPLARPAIAAGVALALMETVADYGTVAHFGVQTLTTGIFSTWLTAGNAGGAAQIACLVMAIVVVLIGVERASRRQARSHSTGRPDRPLETRQLTGWRAGLAFAGCFLPFCLGFLVPVTVMLYQSMRAPRGWLDPGLGQALMNSVTSASIAACVTLLAAVMLTFAVQLGRAAWSARLLPLLSLGYAAPGAVLALGLLVPLAALDHRLADAILAVTGHDPGLMLTGTAFALILAYVVRFFGVAQGAVEAGFGRISPNLGLAARALGQTQAGATRLIYLPMMRGSLATALLLVFVDCVKELPATLLLRPFNYNTLSTRVFEQASLEHLSEAAPAALLVMLVGLAAVVLMIRSGNDHRKP